MNQKTVLLDLDGTVTLQSTWIALNTALGITVEQDEELFQQYREGGLPYIAWIKKLVELYHNTNTVVTRDHLIKIAEETELRPDAILFVQGAKQKGYQVILLSGSLDVLVGHIAQKIDADSWLACSKAVFDGEKLVDIESMGDEGEAKVTLVTDRGIDLSPENCICIGDGGNEKQLFEQTRGVLLGNSETLLPLAWKKVDSLTEAMDLL